MSTGNAARRIRSTLFAIPALILGFAPIAGAVTIDFDPLAVGTTVANQFPEATFSSVAGQEVATISFSVGNSPPNSICTRAVGGSLNCDQELIVDFTDAVFNRSFIVVGDNNIGTQAVVDVYVNFLLNTTVDIVTEGDFSAGLMDLSAFSDITGIVIRDVTDFGGLSFDDFDFEVVAEPSTALLLITGLTALPVLLRRRHER
jgi:hypothetical protein